MPSAPTPLVRPTSLETSAEAAPLTRREAIARERAAAARTGSGSAAARTGSASAAAAASSSSSERLVPVAKHPTASVRTARVAPRGTVPVRVVHQPHAAATTASVAARPPRARRGSAFRRSASRVTAVGALLFVAGLVVSTSVPAQALLAPHRVEPGAVQAAGVRGQSITVGRTTAEAIDRDGYTVSDGAQYQHTSDTFTNDPNGTIQWPFLTGVPITSGFGARSVEGCSFCSTFHEGADFAPGAGTPIRSVAAGTVIKVKADDGGYGNDVWVQHDVDGTQFVSVYGHMADNTFKVVQGQQVTVGQELGLVGSTGNSTGPHLHLEIHVDDVPVDPIAWLRANAN